MREDALSFLKSEFRLWGVSEGWNTTDALARDMGLSREVAYRKLYYLVTTGVAELCGGSWRKKPQQLRLIAAE